MVFVAISKYSAILSSVAGSVFGSAIASNARGPCSVERYSAMSSASASVRRRFGILVSGFHAFGSLIQWKSQSRLTFEPTPARFGPNCRYVPVRSRGAVASIM